MDVSQISIVRCRLDNGRFFGVIPSSLNECLTTEASIDQSGWAFIQDVALSMFDEGVIVILTSRYRPITKAGFKILTMRTQERFFSGIRNMYVFRLTMTGPELKGNHTSQKSVGNCKKIHSVP